VSPLRGPLEDWEKWAPRNFPEGPVRQFISGTPRVLLIERGYAKAMIELLFEKQKKP